MAKPKKLPTGKSQVDFSGRWVCVSEWESDVRIEIKKSRRTYDVRAISEYDGEEAEVHGITSDGETLSFGAYWSSGQFTKYKVQMLGSQLQATYTYTDVAYYKRDVEPSQPDPSKP